MSLEKILLVEAEGEKDLAVVPRKFLFDGEYWSGFRKVSEEEIFNILSGHMEFHERTDRLESDESLKQIIPYFLIRKGDSYLSARRKTKTGDTRLHGSRLIGFGGHLRAGDIRGRMRDWLKREFDEEMNAERVDDISFLGVVNDDSDHNNGVGKVHFGLVFCVTASGDVSIREADHFEDERFISAGELPPLFPEMESWSRLVGESLV